MKSRVIVFGNGQTSFITHFYLTHDSQYEVAAFTADEALITDRELLGLPVVPFEEVEAIFPPGEYQMSVQASFARLNQLRAEKYLAAKAKGYHLLSYVNSRASVWPDLMMGDNCFIGENCVVQPFSEIGNNVVAWPSSVISHHAKVGDHSFLAPSSVLLGNTTLGPYCILGANSIIREHVSVAARCIIGAGAVVLRDTLENGVYVGNPAARMPLDSRQWLSWPNRRT